jgi:hypothetical protein
VPSLWLYAANDRYFGPALADRLFAAFAGATKAEARFVRMPPYGRDGHQTFAAPAAAGHWQEAVSAFLSEVFRKDR